MSDLGRRDLTTALLAALYDLGGRQPYSLVEIAELLVRVEEAGQDRSAALTAVEDLRVRGLLERVVPYGRAGRVALTPAGVDVMERRRPSGDLGEGATVVNNNSFNNFGQQNIGVQGGDNRGEQHIGSVTNTVTYSADDLRQVDLVVQQVRTGLDRIPLDPDVAAEVISRVDEVQAARDEEPVDGSRLRNGLVALRGVLENLAGGVLTAGVLELAHLIR